MGRGHPARRRRGLRVANLIGLGPFVLTQPAQWERQRERLVRALEAGRASTRSAWCSRPDRPDRSRGTRPPTRSRPRWRPVLVEARALGIPFAVEHTNSLRVDVGFVHSLRDVVDLARRLGTGVCMEVNACWAERGLAETIAGSIDVIRLVQVSDFAIGTLATPDRLVPGDGDIPLDRIIGQVLASGYAGVFDLELIGPKIDAEGYASAVPRAVAALGDAHRLARPRRLTQRGPVDRAGVEAGLGEHHLVAAGPGREAQLERGPLRRRLESQPRERRIGRRPRAGRGEGRDDRFPRLGRQVLPEDRVHHDRRAAGMRLAQLRRQPLVGVGTIDVDRELGRDLERVAQRRRSARPARARRRRAA